MTDEDRGRFRPNRNNNNEVLSIAEEILREKSGITPPSERRPILDFSTLQEMDNEQLGQLAELEEIPQWEELSRPERIFQILREGCNPQESCSEKAPSRSSPMDLDS